MRRCGACGVVMMSIRGREVVVVVRGCNDGMCGGCNDGISGRGTVVRVLVH